MGKYCGNRWCLTCNRIRTARAINRYKPVLETWPDPYFVTLTVKNVPGSQLSATLDRMHHEVREIARAIRRTDRLDFQALRKIEVTYNASTEEYHPHFHIVTEGRTQADALVKRWLRCWLTANERAQSIRQCDPSGLAELFKYFTKLIAKRPESALARSAGSSPGGFTESFPGSPPGNLPGSLSGLSPGLFPGLSPGFSSGISPGPSSQVSSELRLRPRGRVAPPGALDVIFRAMKGRRVYQPMGFRAARPVPDEDGEIAPVAATPALDRLNELIEWDWIQAAHDWVDYGTGEVLTGYEPSNEYRRLVAEIDTDR